MLTRTTAAQIRETVAMLAPVKLFLDCRRKSLKVDGIELGRRLNDTSWSYLSLLVEIRPRWPGIAQPNEGVLPGTYLVEKRVQASTCRRELSRQLPNGIARLFVQSVRGKGHRLAHDVKVPGRSEVGLRFKDHGRLQGLDPVVREMDKRYK